VPRCAGRTHNHQIQRLTVGYPRSNFTSILSICRQKIDLFIQEVHFLYKVYALTPEGWRGEMKGRVPLLQHEKALIINTTLFSKEDYKASLEKPMTQIIDNWGLRYPGVKKVEHVYFYRVPVTDDETRRCYLKQAYKLGRNFAQ
jgi:NAD(P)H dehydrogenase (quinone)